MLAGKKAPFLERIAYNLVSNWVTHPHCVEAFHIIHNFYSTLKFVFASVLAICVGIFVYATWHWPLVGDEGLIRYVNFLMSHGMAPYRDIVDINMPGAYAVDWLAQHIFGSSSLAWRMFDFTLLGLGTIAAITIAWPYDWLAGIYGSALFILIHGRDGIDQIGQRDLTISVLLLAAAASLLYASRKNCWPATALFGVFAGLASTIKPTFLPLGFVLLFMLAIHRRRARLPILIHLVSGIICLLMPLLLVVLFLVREHAVYAFLYTLGELIPYHASIGRLPLSYFAFHSFASAILSIALIWLAVAVIRNNWFSWERTVLLVCLGFGLLSLIAQGKDYPYHRYPSEAFLLLLAGIDFTAVLYASRMLKILGLAGLGFGVFVLAPVSTMKAASYQWRDYEFSTMLEADLNNLGGKSLSGHVQCIDTIGGCINTLDQMHLVEATGFLYDCYLFAPNSGAVQREYRDRFWSDLEKNPPKIFIVTNRKCMNEPSTFRKLQLWPRLDDYLHANYRLDIERTPSHEIHWWSHPMRPVSYRIYVRDRDTVKRNSSSENLQ